jgi:hypothetical protein
MKGGEGMSGRILARIEAAVLQHREAPFRSADWLASEVMDALETVEPQPEPEVAPTSAPPSLSPGVGCELEERLLANFLDGTLANAVERLAQDTDDFVARACLYEAADKLRAGTQLYEALERLLDQRKAGFFTEYAWEAARAALARAKGDRA